MGYPMSAGYRERVMGSPHLTPLPCNGGVTPRGDTEIDHIP